MSDLASRITNPNSESPAPEAPDETSAFADAQVDGNVEPLNGSGLAEPDYEVEISLSDLQANEATPFHSAATWEDAGLYVKRYRYYGRSYC